MVYEKFLKDVQPGDILFSFKKGNAFSKLVWKMSLWATPMEKEPTISHAFIYIGNDLIAESTVGHGTIIRSLFHYSPKKYVLYHGKLNINHFSENDADKIVKFAKEYSAEFGYSYFTLVWLFFKRLFSIGRSIDEITAVTCSEFVAMLFEEIGIYLVTGKPCEEISPLELFNSPLIESEEVTIE